MLDAWPVSRRIGSGFLVMTCVVVALSIFSYRAVNNLAQGYLEYRKISMQAVSLNAFLEDFFEAKIAAISYVDGPSTALRAEVRSNILEITDAPELMAPFADSPARKAEVTEIIDLTALYHENFLVMSENLQASADLEDAFEERTQKLKADIDAILSATVQTGTPAAITAAGTALQSALSVIVNSKHYRTDSNPEDLALFQSSFQQFSGHLDRLAALTTQDRTSRQINTFKSELEGFPDALVEFSNLRKQAMEMKANVLDQQGTRILDGFDLLAEDITARQVELGPMGDAISKNLQMIIPVAGFIATLIAVVSAFGIGRWVSGAISRLADTTDALAQGNNDVEISGTEHTHELGRVARALNVFRQAQIERIEVAAEHARLQEQQSEVVETMKAELSKIANGDLTVQIHTAFAADYELLRENFNTAIDALHTAISRAHETTAMIAQTTSQTTSATNELSQRTENQAATLEQTAAALDELTASVKSAAEHAKSVDVSVIRARTEATKNGEIVAQAVAAMAEIETSSKQISQVIGVIDDIAFQTNLLALNAGVEAARAGESGKGFAVVASEVRALAQRSAEAAKEISGLIANSSRHVEQGTELVGNAGDALGEIITQVNDISAMTSQIATSAEEQAIGLSEINIGVNQLDQVTQKNAAMVQDQMMRGDLLASETQKLSKLIKQFRISERGSFDQPSANPEHDLETAIAGTHGSANAGHGEWQSA